jgi:hypothetical protein
MSNSMILKGYLFLPCGRAMQKAGWVKELLNLFHENSGISVSTTEEFWWQRM